MKRALLFIVLLLMLGYTNGQPHSYKMNPHVRFENKRSLDQPNDSQSGMSSITKFMPLIVFFLGLLLIPLTDRFKRNKHLKMLELYFNELVTLLNQQVSKQILEIQKCIEDTKNLNQNTFTLTRISGCSITNLEKVNSENLFKIYILRRKKRYKDKIQDFKNLNEIINYFREAIPHLVNSNEQAINLFDSYRLDWNRAQNDIVDVYNKFITSNGANGIRKGEDEFVDKLCFVFDSFFDKYGIDVQNIKLGYDEFIEPLIEFSKNYSTDFRSFYLLSALQVARHSYKELMTVREDHEKFLTVTSEDMTVFNNKLIELMKKLKNQKLKLL